MFNVKNPLDNWYVDLKIFILFLDIFRYIYIKVVNFVNYIDAMLDLAHRHRNERHLEDQVTLLQ
jgi:hypothetical protein